MAFGRLPNEILENIIAYTLPEGFEGLALTSKHTYGLSTRFIEHHNKLRIHFQDFHYDKQDLAGKTHFHLAAERRPYKACSAFNLIVIIAAEPVIANYIQKADFEDDSLCLCIWNQDRELAKNSGHDNAVIELLANSSYLKEAGLDWRTYWAAIEGDLDAGCYSQHAAVFALTLLPNVTTLKLPRRWKPTAVADKLLDAVIHKARQPCLPYDRPSIAQVSGFEASVKRTTEISFDMYWAIPFLALPHVQSFRGFNFKGTGSYRSIESKFVDTSDFEAAIEVVDISYASVDGAAIADFLKNTPRLRVLSYQHAISGNFVSQNWDLCQFITAIENEVGSHLEKLSIRINELHYSIVPGRMSLSGFQNLRELELPLDAAMANHELLLSDIIPASVSTLSLLSHGKGHHVEALDVFFCDFAAKKDDQVPALEEIYLFRPKDADKLYKERCEKLPAEIGKAGVRLHVTS